MDDTKYCLCCGDQVPCSVVIRHERREITCAYCGFTLDIQSLDEPHALPQPMSKEGYALVADDSRYTRKIIEDLLKEKQYSSHVLSFENGLELISAYSRLLTEKRNVDVAIIDLNMPVMDGLTAARTIRALEAQNKVRTSPIVFFSAEQCGQDLKQQMETLEPANYVNKGSDPDPDKLAQRVEFLLAYLAEKYKEAPV
ncbi:MAG: response regulator [Nitrospirae bacterium]|nr:MAG: response regulator [Nitrospirota bacterium]